MKRLMALVVMVTQVAYCDLGIMDTASESAAKNEVAGMGVTQVYDHPNQPPIGQFVVPVQYNRTNAEGNGTEHDGNDSKPNDIDYVPLTQLKGATGAQGIQGTQGSVGATGTKGDIGDKGNNGANGKDGRNGIDATINNHLFLNVGLNLRWYDWKHVSLNSGYHYDFRHFNHTVDVAVIQIKLSRSYEQRELESLRKEVELLSLQRVAFLGE